VVAGTATAVSNRVSRRQAARWSDQGQEQQYEEPPQQYAPPPPPPDPGPDKYAQLKQLAELKTAGVVTEAEFEVEKAKLLGF